MNLFSFLLGGWLAVGLAWIGLLLWRVGGWSCLVVYTRSQLPLTWRGSSEAAVVVSFAVILLVWPFLSLRRLLRALRK